MYVTRIVATLEDETMGQIELEMMLVGEFRRRGVNVGELPDDRLMAVLAVPSDTPDALATAQLVDALQMVARAAVDMAAESGRLTIGRMRKKTECVS